MSKSAQLSSAAGIEAEASAWIVQLDGAAMSKRDIEAFREWCSRSPAHADAVHQAAQIWGDVDVLTDLADLIRDEKKADRAYSGGRRSAGIIRGLASVVVIALVAIIGFEQFARVSHQSAPVAEPLLVETRIGQQLERTLADGSLITLNTDTRLEVDFDDKVRRVRILSGEALFDVAHETKRPFIVYAEGEMVRAVGTKFVVRVTDTIVSVTVTEGVVEYAPVRQLATSASPDALTPIAVTGRLKAGQSIRLGVPDPIVKPINRAEIRRTLAWTDGVVMFSGETLEEVILELSRYTDDIVVFDDDATRAIKVGGVFETGNMDTLWDALENSFDIDVDQKRSGEIHLSMHVD